MVRVADVPLYKLSVVLEATGLTADVVRAWERRYGLPRPQRTPGGHRLYTRRDIRTLQWLLARRTEGLRISQAVSRWRDLEAAGCDPLTVVQEEASPLEEVRAAWLRAGLDFDEGRAEVLLKAALAAYPPEAVIGQVLQRGLHTVGELWYRAEISVQQEHFISELAMRCLYTLMASAPRPTREERLLLGTPSGERHAFPALLLAVWLRLRGWQSVYLGVEVPIESLRGLLIQAQPSAVLYSVQMLGSVPALQEAAQWLGAAGVPVGYGGGVFNSFPALQARIPAFFLGENLAEALEEVETLTQLSPAFPPPPPVEPGWLRAAEALRLHVAYITAQVQERMAPYGVGAGEIALVMTFMHEQASAALRLGDLAPLRAALRWVEGWLRARQVDAEGLMMLWRQWKEALIGSVGDAVAPLLAFLETEV